VTDVISQSPLWLVAIGLAARETVLPLARLGSKIALENSSLPQVREFSFFFASAQFPFTIFKSIRKSRRIAKVNFLFGALDLRFSSFDSYVAFHKNAPQG
jgi:hypothetical protein